MMNEIEITSGRMNPHIDPHLSIWGWEIPLYLFIGGLVAGILFFSTLFYIRGKSEEYPTAVKKISLFAGPLLALGLLALFLDLSHKLYVWRFYTTIRWESPMSWGSWTLLIITPLSILWSMIWIEDLWLSFKWPFAWLSKFVTYLKKYKAQMAWTLLIGSIILGMYTGILLSAFNARPFWNSAILGPLFLVSGLSTGAALIIIFSKSEKEKKLFSTIDVTLIGIELFLLIHLFMGFLASTQVHIEAADLFLGGDYTAAFWVLVVGLGLILPLLIEILELRGFHVPVIIPSLLVLFGGLILRFIVVDAGQTSRWLYKFME
jgi:formate-dependent nitrite reductase membrane component NrfD